MNTFQFLDYLKGSLAQKDLGAYSVDDANTIVQAINRATLDWWNKAPMSASNQPFGIMLPGRRQFTVEVTKGSKTITFTPAITTEEVGRAMTVDGDNVRNVVMGTSSMLLPSSITGTATAYIFGNAFGMPVGFEALTSPVWLESPYVSQMRWPIIQVAHDELYWLDAIPWFSATPRPLYFSLRSGQTFNGNAPFHIMQFYPMPAENVRISFEYTGKVQPWTISDLSTPRDLGLEPTAWTLLVDVVVYYLANTGLLRSGIDMNRVDSLYANALEGIRLTLPQFRGPITIGTQEGY